MKDGWAVAFLNLSPSTGAHVAYVSTLAECGVASEDFIGEFRLRDAFTDDVVLEPIKVNALFEVHVKPSGIVLLRIQRV